jgi:type IV secretion system protein VirD4
MTGDQILDMNPDEVLLLIGNRRPLRAKQNLYFQNRIYQGKWDRNPLL